MKTQAPPDNYPPEPNLPQLVAAGEATRWFAVILYLLLVGNCPIVGIAQGWKLTSAPKDVVWIGLACSADGQTFYAADSLGPLSKSPNAGLSWMPTGPRTNWYSVSCSADGSKVAGMTGGEFPHLFRSRNFGATWVSTRAPGEWPGILAMSANGSRIFRTGQRLFSSSDFGETWTNYPTPFLLWIDCSADGQKLIAQGQGPHSPVYVSTNAGATWNPTEVYNDYPAGVAISADGAKMIAASWTPTINGPVYVSHDSGVSWFTADIPWDSWSSVCSAADGNTLAARGYSTWVSTDSGQSWELTDLKPIWVTYLASSADGCRLFAASQMNGIFVRETTPKPLLQINRSSETLHLSWIMPSRAFVLQQSSALGDDWTAVAQRPTLNYSNLHHEVTLPASSGQVFYRLVMK